MEWSGVVQKSRNAVQYQPKIKNTNTKINHCSVCVIKFIIQLHPARLGHGSCWFFSNHCSQSASSSPPSCDFRIGRRLTESHARIQGQYHPLLGEGRYATGLLGFVVEDEKGPARVGQGQRRERRSELWVSFVSDAL